MTPDQFHALYGESANYWTQDPDFPRADWKRDVATAKTLLGYWDWVAAKLQPAQEDAA